jgi:hypothetical protein
MLNRGNRHESLLFISLRALRRVTRYSPVLAVFLIGCGTDLDVVRVNSPARLMCPKGIYQVQMFVGAPPPRPFMSIGMIQARQQTYSSTSKEEMIRQIRERAAEWGCDGVIINGPNNGTAGSEYGAWTLDGISSTCIQFTDVPASSGASAEHCPPRKT